MFLKKKSYYLLLLLIIIFIIMKAIQANHEDRINHELLSQGFVISSVIKYSLSRTTFLWSKVQESLP